MTDLIVRNASLVDGTGSPQRAADIAIEGGRIVAVGENVGTGSRTIDADGRLVTPGWVDMHTHYDAQVTWDPEMTPSGWHGVTTVVMGNCGVGFAPVVESRRQWLLDLMEGVEDIPGAAMAEGIEWEWETFPEYLDALERRSTVLDFGTQLPHGALRTYVMGERGAMNDAPTEEEIERMAELTTEAMRSGALGFSTSRTPLHKSLDGELVPGTTAKVGELLGIAEGLRAAGHGGFQAALHHTDVPASMQWMKDVARRIHGPVTFNYSQTDQSPDLWTEVLAELDSCHAEGVNVWGQVAGRPIGVLMGWESSAHPFMGHTRIQALRSLDRRARLARLRDPEFRAAVLADVPVGLSRFQTALATSFDKMFPMEAETDYEPHASSSLDAVARREGVSPVELAYDHLLEHDGRGLLYFPLFNFSNDTLDPLREMHSHPQTRMGLADAGAHCAAICDGGMPTFMVSFWCRDRTNGDRLPLEHVVHRQTQATAGHYGLHDRGVIAPGYRADLNIIDFDQLGVDMPRMVYDLPSGAKRFVQGAVGYDYTIVAGEIVREDGNFTGARPGRLIRGPQNRS